MHIRKEPGVTK